MKTKADLSIYLSVAIGVSLMLTTSCTKDDESLPVLTTSHVTYISEQSVIFEGTVTDDGGATITERGICWSTNHNPTAADDRILNGTGIGSFTCTIDGLNTNTQYYARAFATSSGGTGYGGEVAFHTWNSELVTDIDNNVYHTLTVGSQVWLVENLKVTHYQNGDPIPNITDNGSWEGLTSGAYRNYDNDPVNNILYGRLYNWFAVNDGRNIAPSGWHVASDEEWTLLSNYLGGDGISGGKLKEAGTLHWLDPNSGATNETGFSALPGGHCDYAGNSDYMFWGGGWWCSTEENDNDSWVRYLDHGSFDCWRSLEGKRYGRSVRCVKD